MHEGRCKPARRRDGFPLPGNPRVVAVKLSYSNPDEAYVEAAIGFDTHDLAEAWLANIGDQERWDWTIISLDSA